MQSRYFLLSNPLLARMIMYAGVMINPLFVTHEKVSVSVIFFYPRL